MKYYVEQRLFSFFDKFDIYDENGDVAYHVEGSFLSFGKQFRIYDKHNNQVLPLLSVINGRNDKVKRKK